MILKVGRLWQEPNVSAHGALQVTVAFDGEVSKFERNQLKKRSTSAQKYKKMWHIELVVARKLFLSDWGWIWGPKWRSQGPKSASRESNRSARCARRAPGALPGRMRGPRGNLFRRGYRYILNLARRAPPLPGGAADRFAHSAGPGNLELRDDLDVWDVWVIWDV